MRANIKISNIFQEFQIIICLCLYGFRTGQLPGCLQFASTKYGLHTCAYQVVTTSPSFSTDSICFDGLRGESTKLQTRSDGKERRMR